MNSCWMLTLLLGFQNNDLVVNEQFRVEYVLLDVLAIGKNGLLVTDLRKEDFEIRENKKKVDLNYFEILDFRDTEKQLSTNIREVPEVSKQRPTQQVILALDLESAKPLQIKLALTQMYDFVKDLEERGPFQIILYSMERGDLTDGFVSSARQVREALDELERRLLRKYDRARPDDNRILRDRNSSSTLRFQDNNRGLLMDKVNDLADLERAFSQCRRMNFDEEDIARCVTDTLRDFSEQMEIRTERVLGELEVLTYKFQEVEGLKVMMFVSPGFVIDSLSSVHSLAESFIPRDGDRQTMGTFLGGAGRLRLDDEYQRVVHACIKNRVIFHTIDIFNGQLANTRQISSEYSGGGGGNLSFIYNRYNSEITEGLRELALDSGGTFTQSNHLSEPIRRAMDSDLFFYVLGYNSPEWKPGRFRKIKLKLSKKRKGVKLRYRHGYVGAK